MRKIALFLPLIIAVAAIITIALTQQQQPDIVEATDDMVELDFIIVANPGDVVGTPWTEGQVKNLISGANAIYAANFVNIYFNWPKQSAPEPVDRFKYIDDPQKAVGGPGDVKVPPLSPQVPYVGEHLPFGQGTGLPDDKSPEEASIICNNAWANANPGMLPVALVQHFTDLKGAKAPLLGVAYTNIGTKQPGFCILMSVQAKNNPQTFAHELGHVLCLAHVDKPNNLMEPIKAPGGNLLNPGQVAQLCPKLMQDKVLSQQPPGKIPTPTPTVTPTITPTATVTPTPTITPTPTSTKQPFKGDTDGDGCPDVNENLPKSAVMQGGGRDWQKPYDWYDINQDGVIDLPLDILGVIDHWQPLPGGAPPYDIAFDRGAAAPGSNYWERSTPDGIIDLVTDILGVIDQWSPLGCTDPGP